MAAVALFSMSSFADEPVTDQVWTKVTDGTSLKAFDYVTFVDVNAKKVYNGFKHAVKYEGENPGSEGTGFWVVDGWAPEEGSPVAADYPESSWAFRVEDEEAEGPLFTYFTEDAEVTGRDLNSLVSWDKDLISDGYVKSLASKRYVYYDKTAGYFWTKPEPDKVGLYKQTELARPVFDPTSSTIWVNPEAPAGPSINISIPGIGENDPVGSISWKQDDGDYNDDNGTSTDVTPEYEDGVPVKITAKNVYEGGETQEVTETYTFVEIELPYFDPETGIKIANDGTAMVEILDDTEGAAIKYYVAEKGKEPEEPTFEDYSEALDLAEYVGKTVVVYAKATKGGAETSVVSAEYTIEPNATAEDLELELNADPKEGSEVGGGDIVSLWWVIGNTEYDYYEIAPNGKVTELTLTFHTDDGDVDETVKAVIKKDKVTFKVPGKPEYYGKQFDVAVPEGFYLATAGKNVVETPEATVTYVMGLGSSDFIIDPETTYQPTDDNTILVRVYPRNNENAEVDFANPVEGDSNYGAKFTDAESEWVTDITKVEKIAADEEGNPLPNTFEITFENGDGKADFIKKYLKMYAHLTPQEEQQLNFSGYNVGFPAGTFKSDLYINGEDLNHHVKFVESVDIKIIPSYKTICEGDRMMIYTLQLTGNVSGDSYNTPYDSDKESEVVFDDEAEVTIKGTNIFGEEVDLTCTLSVAEPKDQKAKGVKETYTVNWKRYSALDPENPLDFGWTLRTDNGQNYEVTIPAGTFKVNLSENDEYKGTADVMAHPNWAATARPYSFDEGKQETSTLVLDLTATLDNPIKVFEKNLRVNNEEAVFTVEGADGTQIEVESWEFDGPTEAYSTTFESKPSYMFDGRDGKWLNGSEGVQEEAGVIILHLATPIADVQKYTITIPAEAFRANTCLNKKFSVEVLPYVTYFIQEIKYIIPTDQESVTYDIWGQLPDGSKLDAPIAYIGETDPELRTLYNALRYNNERYVDVDETGSGEKIIDGEWFYPEVKSTKFNKDEKTTTFTITFPNGLIPGYYKMNFPAGTVQAEGYVANDVRLYNPFDVVPAFVYDATSSEEDYNQPGKYPKEKEYNISTKTTEITLYLTAENPDDEYTNNSNSDILLIEGTQLGFAEGIIDDEADAENGKFTYEKDHDGIFKVTFDALQPGQYTLVVPSHSVTTKSTFKILGTATALNTDNPEAFFLTINVEDFAGPEDAVKITTKTYAFDVKVGDEGTKMTVLNDEEGNAPTVQLGGAQATLENSDKPGYVRVVLPTAEKEECKPCFDMPKDAPELVKGAIEDELEEEEEVTEPKLGYFFMHSCQEPEEEPAPYPLVIPAGSFKGQYATNYDDIEANVDVIFEFIDSGTGITDDLEDPNDLTTTFCEVLDEVYVQKEMLFTRAFRNQNMQALAVPFDIKQSEVADYFTIYRLDMVWEDSKGDFQLNYLSVGEDGIAYANKPYIIVPTAKAVEETEKEGFVKIPFTDKKVEYPMMSFINCATTKVHFQFFNTLFKQEFAEDMVEEYKWKTLSGGKIGNINGTVPAWRWWIAPVEKFGNYVKIALDGFVQDDADGIDFVEATEGDTQIFNVAGQKLNTAAKGKVNIINGKKVFVK